MRILETSLWLPQSPDEIFPFFADAKNLERITPPWLNFRILSQSTPQIQKGTIFEYKLKIKGFPVRWSSLIEDWQVNRSFVDTQLRGPYKLWHHTHTFESDRGGTRMLDRVKYELPLGKLGDFLAGAYVRKDVEGIFAYRENIVREMFAESKIPQTDARPLSDFN